MKKIKILVIEDLHPILINYLKSSSRYQFDFFKNPISIDFLNQIISSYHILIIRGGTKIKNEIFFKNAISLKLIIRSGKGIDNIDVDMCKKYSIEIFSIENANTTAVAEFTIGLILCLTRNIFNAHQDIMNNFWRRKKFCTSNLEKKKIGFVGFGKISQAIFNRLKNFNVQSYFFDPYISFYPKNIISISLEKLFSICDIITIHLPLKEDTTEIINHKYLSLMKKKAFLINTSRGKILNEKDLFFYLKKNKIQGAAIDVFEEEPLTKNHPLKNLKNIILTPHIAGSTKDSEINIAKEIKKKLIDFVL